MKYEREKKIGKAIEMVWTSLESHLLFPYQKNFRANWKGKKKSDEIKFHKQCVREYAELIKIISELY